MPVAPRPVRAVLFDMDGVIVDSRSIIELAWSEVAHRHTGRTPTQAEIEEHVHGRTGSHTVVALFPDHTDRQRRELWAEVDRIEETAPYRLIAGVRELIADLNAQHIATGLVTSSWPAKIDHVLGLLDLPAPFRAIISRDDVEHGKPHPEPYSKGCAALAVSAEETLVFEDAVSGVSSATAAGTRCIGIGSPDLVEAGAFAVVSDFTTLHLEVTHGAPVLLGVEPALPLAPWGVSAGRTAEPDHPIAGRSTIADSHRVIGAAE